MRTAAIICLFAIYSVFLISCNSGIAPSVSSPNGKIKVEVNTDNQGMIRYSVYYSDTLLIDQAPLGIIRSDVSFDKNLQLTEVSKEEPVHTNYSLLYGKKKNVNYSANRRSYDFVNPKGKKMNIIFQISNDGIGFRYSFPGKSDKSLKITSELTGFKFKEGTHTWIQPKAKAKTGWCHVNPSYEENYQNNIAVKDIPDSTYGWVFPALFHYKNFWMVLSETFPQGNYCGSHLFHPKNSLELNIAFPEKSEGFPGGVVLPESKLPWKTPWRIIGIGDKLSTIAESTLGTDLMPPPAKGDYSWVKPGRSSWSWVLMKDASVNYKTQKEFIDYAADMGWEYCLIDADWDQTIGWDKIKELADYAAKKNVGLLLWYNSSGSWNTTVYTPKGKLLTHASREAEFTKLEKAGIKGIKVDFFGGDGQSMMTYYLDILKDANEHHLMVNCHGSTLPRGLERTYPNLVSMEAIRGLEYATFEQASADRVPVKSTIVPFTRNVFDPMDFTPVCFTEYDHDHRVTGNGAELAQAVVFLSGIQHYAVTPKGMATVPDYVKNVMKEIPVAWDETRFIAGFPGKYVVIARRKEGTWYVAGINGENAPLKLNLHIPIVAGLHTELITDGANNRSFRQQKMTMDQQGKFDITLIPYGGFLLKTE